MSHSQHPVIFILIVLIRLAFAFLTIAVCLDLWEIGNLAYEKVFGETTQAFNFTLLKEDAILCFIASILTWATK